MKSPGFIDGSLVALLISLGVAVCGLLFGGLIESTALHHLLLAAATLVYLLYLLKRSRTRIGRVVIIAAWVTSTLACWIVDAPLFTQVLLQAGFIWLTRSLYFHATLIAAIFDFGLVTAGLAAGAWALQNTGSPATALWSFFLIQALFCWIPQFTPNQNATQCAAGSNPRQFQSAHRVALDAVRKLTQA